MSYHKFSNLGERFNDDLTQKIMMNVIDENWKDRPCNCNKTSLKENGECLYENNCRKTMIVYDLECTICDLHYIGKTQRYFKERTSEHFQDVWKVIESGRKNFGPNWKGSGGYSRADAFAKHFAQHCRNATNSNQTRAMLKKIVTPKVIWQGDCIRCTKSARTLQCKICMVERKEILKRMRTNKQTLINDNSDIYSSCKCEGRFHKFTRKLEIETLRTRLSQKKVSSTRTSKQKRKRFSFNSITSSPTICSPCNEEAPITPEPASLQTPVFLIDTNIPGLPWRPPTANPTNLELAQLQHYQQTLLEVVEA